MREYIRKNRQVYNQLAENYLSRMKTPGEFQSKPEELAGYVFHYYVKMYSKKPRKVLELGPGAGAVLKAFTDFGCATTAIEFSTKMAHIACKNSPRTTFLIKDVTTCGNLLYNQFDIVFASAFIHLFPIDDEKRILNKVKKWATRDGLIYLNTTVHDFSEEGVFLKEDYGKGIEHFRRRWSRSDFINFLRQNNFNILDMNDKEEMDRKKVWMNFILKNSRGGL